MAKPIMQRIDKKKNSFNQYTIHLSNHFHNQQN